MEGAARAGGCDEDAEVIISGSGDVDGVFEPFAGGSSADVETGGGIRLDVDAGGAVEVSGVVVGGGVVIGDAFAAVVEVFGLDGDRRDADDGSGSAEGSLRGGGGGGGGWRVPEMVK